MNMITGNNQLLKIKEQLSENLSSVQIAKTLDDLLMNCLKPIISNTYFIEYVLVELLPHIFTNQRRRFSNKPLDKLRDALFSFIVLDDVEEKTMLLSKQGLERSIFFAALEEFEKSAQLYMSETEKQIENIFSNDSCDHQILEAIAKPFYPRKDFYQTSKSTIFWLNNTYKFRAMIVEKYIRHAYIESAKAVANTELHIDQTDLWKDLIVSMHRAINKYDAEQGPLTNYINIWFREAKTNYRNSHEYGMAFQMPAGQRKKLLEEGSVQNFTMELNEKVAESVEDLSQDILSRIIQDKDEEIFHNIIARADKWKVYSLINNVKYTLTKEDLALQEETLKPISH